MSGKYLPEVVQRLVKIANDTSFKVKSTIEDSLIEIGKADPNLVVKEAKNFLETSKEAPIEHRVSLWTVIRKVLQERLENVDADVCISLIAPARTEMTKTEEINDEVHGAISSVLVTVGMRFSDKVITDLLQSFGTGVIPHYYIIKTLADLSLANPVGFIPFLEDIFKRIIAILPNIKKESIMSITASAIGSFCEAILSYKVNATSSAIDTSIFAPQALSAYEFLSTKWLKSKDKKVRLVSIQSIGSTCAIITPTQLATLLPKLVPIFNGMYKNEKTSDHLAITQGYCSLLRVSTSNDETSKALEPLREGILNIVFPLVCKPVDYSDSNQIKNNNELLRSIEIIAKRWIEETLQYLFVKTEHKDPSFRNGTMSVIKHLITRIQPQLEGKKELIVGALKPMSERETDINVKKSLAQVTIAMANENYLNLLGGESLIEFIILNSSITDEEIKRWEEANQKKKPAEQSNTSPAELRSMCDHILSLMTTTIPSMVDVLWPYLFMPLTQPRFSSSMAVVAKCIAHISEVKRKSNSTNYLIDFAHSAYLHLPKPQEIMARLFVLANLPFRRGSLALHLLETMLHTGPILHPAISNMWDSTIPRLTSYLNNIINNPASKTEVEVNKWEGLIRRLLTETIKMINDDMWVMGMGDAIINQLPLYSNDPGAKKVALKTIGVVLSQISHKEYIKRSLETLFNMVNHSIEDERVGLAQGYGYCGSTHLDIILEYMNNLTKTGGAPKKAEEPVKKDDGFLSSLFSSSGKTQQAGGDFRIHTVMLSYGYVTAYAKTNYITSRLDIRIINNMTPYFESSDQKLQQTMIQAMDLIGQTVTAEHLQTDYIFKYRDNFINYLINYLRLTQVSKQSNERTGQPVKAAVPQPTLSNITINPTKIKIAVLALNACSTVTVLEPGLPADVESDLLKVTAQYFTVQKDSSSTNDEETDLSLIYNNLDRLYLTILTKDPSISCLKRLTSTLVQFFSSAEGSHRSRAISSYSKILKKYIEILGTKKPSEKSIPDLGPMVSSFYPRCCDPVAEVRGLSIESIQLLLYVQWMLSKFQEEPDKPISEIDIKPPKSLSPFTALKKRIQQLDDLNEQFNLVRSMSAILAKVVTKEDLPSMLLSSLSGLLDSQPSSARGTCVIIYGIVSARGPDLEKHVIPLVKGLIDKLQYLSNEQTANGTKHALKSIAKLHLQDTMEAILTEEIPHKPHVTGVVQLLARDNDLVLPVVKMLTDILNNGDLMEDEPVTTGGKNLFEQVPTLESQAATISLAEMLHEEELEDIVNQNFALVCCTLLLRVGTTSGHAASSAQTIQCWKNFFNVLEEEDVLQKMEELGTFQMLPEKNRYIEGISILTSTLCKRHSGEMRTIHKTLQPYLKGNYNGQRLVTAFAYAEMINHANGDPDLLDLLVSALLNSLVDPILKIPALRGFGNIVSCSQEHINKYAPTILDALMSSIDHKDDMTALESMNALAKVFKVVDESRIAPILINICHRIRPAFDNLNDNIRASSAFLFATLARFGEGMSKESFYEQIHTNLPSIILHINDDNPAVQKAFKHALYSIGPLMRDNSIVSILNTSHIFKVEGEIDYSEFLHMHLSKCLIQGWPDRINSYVQTCINPYFTSHWDTIKANAAYFIGSIMGHIPLEKRKEVGINAGHTAKALIQLLNEPSPIVRQKTVESISMLYSY